MVRLSSEPAPAPPFPPPLPCAPTWGLLLRASATPGGALRPRGSFFFLFMFCNPQLVCMCSPRGTPISGAARTPQGLPPATPCHHPPSPPVSCGSVSCGPAVCLLPAFLPSYPILHPCQRPQRPAHLPGCPRLCVLGPLGLRSGVSGQPSSPCAAQTGPGRGAQNLNEGLWVRRREGALEKLEKVFSWPRLCRAVPTQAQPWVRTEERQLRGAGPLALGRQGQGERRVAPHRKPSGEFLSLGAVLGPYPHCPRASLQAARQGAGLAGAWGPCSLASAPPPQPGKCWLCRGPALQSLVS